MTEKQDTVNATLMCCLNVECPNCKSNVDLFDNDDDGIYIRPIFNNSWDDLSGEDVECPACLHEFKIGSVEY